MNCIKGDLAYVFRSTVGNYGKTVTCLRLATANDFALDHELVVGGPCWVVDRDLRSIVEARLSDGTVYFFERPTRICPDAILRPLRDPGDSAVDETLLRIRIPEVDTV